jgi:hypothetical protein
VPLFIANVDVGWRNQFVSLIMTPHVAVEWVALLHIQGVLSNLDPGTAYPL